MNPKRTVNIVSDLDRVNTTCKKMQTMLSDVRQYVDDVLVSPTYSLLTHYLHSTPKESIHFEFR